MRVAGFELADKRRVAEQQIFEARRMILDKSIRWFSSAEIPLIFFRRLARHLSAVRADNPRVNDARGEGSIIRLNLKNTPLRSPRALNPREEKIVKIPLWVEDDTCMSLGRGEHTFRIHA